MPAADTNHSTQVPQSEDLRPSHGAIEEYNNNNMLQPEEWEDYEENAGVTNPFHDVESSSQNIMSPNHSTTSFSHLDQNHFPVNSHAEFSNSHNQFPTPAPSYTSLEPVSATNLNLTSRLSTPFSTPSFSSSHSQSPLLNDTSASTSTPTTNSTNRIARLPSRGLPHNKNPATNKHWLPIMQSYISYTFTNPDILEEALETPKNGVTCVGKTMRICLDGNEGLGKLGEMVMKLVLREQYYLFSIPEVQASQITNRILDRVSLYAHPTIASCIRPQPYIPISFRNIIELVKEESREDNTRCISRAVKAVIGAVYLDGGVENAKKVMENLQMGIKLPPGSRG